MTLTLRIAALSVALCLPFAAHAADEHYIVDGAAIGGYDVVSYHTKGEPTKGDANFTATYQGVEWQFASAENRDLFAAGPAKFAPAYGGWCSVGASKGKKINIDPAFFAVVDGQLFLNSSKGAHENVFLTDTSGTISKGDKNWRTISATEADKL